MANPDHLAILKQGVEVWNRWRHDHETHVMPDLKEADLPGANLSSANLSWADLRSANLRDAQLDHAILAHANLGPVIEEEIPDSDEPGAGLFAKVFNYFRSSSDLTNADLSNADLSNASLKEAYLTNAKLCSADLRWCNLTGVWVRHADMSGAIMGRTTLADLDMTDTHGLDTVRHFGPSSIDLDTVFRSLPAIPEAFLRGAGASDEFLRYAKALEVERRTAPSVFLSYSSQDEEFADRLYADLQNSGVRCWFAPEDLKIGDLFRQRIDESIRAHEKLLLILSEHSVQSTWVQDEVESALDRERREGRLVLFPIRIDDAVMETDQAWAKSIRLKRHIGDFTRWKDHDSYKKAFERLLRDLKAEEASP